MTYLTDFEDTERFTVQRRLGSGGFGVVYQVYDHDENSRVALKILARTDARALYRFKREFRALAGVEHPNLVTLHELMSDGQRWFFTMELVEGVSFLEYVRSEHRRELAEFGSTLAATATMSSSTTQTMQDAETQVFGPREQPAGGPRVALSVDLNRLRAALRQLVNGVSALHRIGQLHRDLKPSNVLVDRNGRVVVLDFGLITELVPEALEGTAQLIGTPAYMSPEHAAGLPISEASDWYSVGVMLYQALTGHLPFSGPFMRVVTNKQKFDPPSPDQLVHGIPEDLTYLCRALLRRDPRERPSAREILRRLEGIFPIDSTPLIFPPRRTVRLVGRESHLGVLTEAYEASNEGRAVVVFVHGSSGMGKTALVQCFLEQLRQKEDIVILRGRCYERESVPYKALDSVVDALSQYLRGLSTSQVEAALPRDVLALSRLFPVLRQVQPVTRARRRVPEIPDSQELRRRAFAALRDLLARLAEQKSIVLFIDDLQWGDIDSVALLEEILSPPDPPALLLIAGYRSEEAETSPALQKLIAFAGTRAAADTRKLVVGKLDFSEVRALALSVLGERSPIATGWTETIARESGGNPYFIHELVQFFLVSLGEGSGPGPARCVGFGDDETTLKKVIEARISRLTEPERRFLEVVAVAGKPVRIHIAREAAAVDTGEPAALATLRSGRLVRFRGSDSQGDVEVYHDRIRETVIANLSTENLKSHHSRLAFALETSGRADSETLAAHFQGAGDAERAAEYATKAADQAIEALAFERAARLYRFVLNLQVQTGLGARNLWVRLADALANGGRGLEAAQAYLTASEEAASPEKLELQRRAAEQLLRSGYIDDGIKVLRTVLACMGMRLAATPRRALFSLLLRRAFVWARGLGFRQRNPNQISAEELIRVDTCWSVAVGLGIVDTIRGADFHKRHLLLALRMGEPYRVARALALEVGYSASGGSHTHRRTQSLVRTTQELADRINQPHALGLAALTAGIAAYLEGRWRDGALLTTRAGTILREGCTGVAWELANVEIFHFLSLYYLGELAELSRRLPKILKDVEDRGDLFAATSLRARISFIARLAADDPNTARSEVEEAIERWSHQAFHVQHLWAAVGKMEIALYCGDVVEAWKIIKGSWPGLTRSLLLRIQQPFVGSLHHRARCALAMASVVGVDQAYRTELLRSAECDAHRMEKQMTVYGDGMARLIRAGVAATRGHIEEAVRLTDQAEAVLLRADMGLYAAAARRRKGEIIGGDQGTALVEAADAWMSNQSVKNPRRLVGMLVPGRWTRS